jgi:hypothetical protein
VPTELTFVFGHTHKPFVGAFRFEGFAAPCPVVNTGGWVVDGPDAAPERGAAVALVDSDLHVVNLRLYTEGSYAPSVEPAPGSEASALCRELSRCVQPDRPPWSALTEAVKKTVGARRRRAAA